MSREVRIKEARARFAAAQERAAHPAMMKFEGSRKAGALEVAKALDALAAAEALPSDSSAPVDMPPMPPPPVPAPPRVATVTPIKKPVAPPRVQAAPPPAPIVSAGTVPPPAPPVPAPPAIAADPTPAVPSAMPVIPPETRRGNPITLAAQLELFKGCVYVQDLHAIIVPGVDAPLDQKRFDVRFGGREYLTEKHGTSGEESAWQCFTCSQLHEFPRVDATYFDPRDPAGYIKTEAEMTFVNTYVPLTVEMIPGDPAPFIDHIQKILPNGNDAQILTSYLAGCVQYPGIKAMWAPLLQGVEGNGKSIIAKVMGYAIGSRYMHPARAGKIDSRFNSHLYGKLLVVINEVKVTQDKQSVWETLKTLITDDEQEIEYKGGAVVKRKLCFNILFTTNHEDAIAKTANDRRICPLFCAQQSAADLKRDGMGDGHTSAYFRGLWGWLNNRNGFAIAAHHLKHYAIPDDLNFATECTRAPRTTATDRAIAAGLGNAEQEVAEAIEEGRSGFRGGWIASHALNQLMDQSSKGRLVARNKRRDMLKALGYVKHPGLDDGRSPVPIPVTGWADNPRPRLYIKQGHPSETLRGVEVTAAYVRDQASIAEPVPLPPPPPPSRM